MMVSKNPSIVLRYRSQILLLCQFQPPCSFPIHYLCISMMESQSRWAFSQQSSDFAIHQSAYKEG